MPTLKLQLSTTSAVVLNMRMATDPFPALTFARPASTGPVPAPPSAPTLAPPYIQHCKLQHTHVHEPHSVGYAKADREAKVVVLADCKLGKLSCAAAAQHGCLPGWQQYLLDIQKESS